ncbi:CPBP family intramembrane glutamic endopeptidase [Bacillus sp. CGMCC 1.16541]|uniref:CPBP family intramembrane glutamic endopeptidase n=1 Tax=Bacillus sp. CGMCC 1.16541 TaxID=2185143 RepID=UPI000D737D79|nr:CPBP family intramembrane glutamic endopeptidase [Bacillus sp. CGMCC 1.16541]
MKTDVKKALMFSVFGLLGGFFLTFAQLETLKEVVPKGQENLVVLASTIQVGVITFVLSLIGLKLMKRTDLMLRKSENEQKGFALAVALGVLIGLIIIGSDYFIFRSFLPQLTENEPAFSFIGLLMGIFYGGVVEEVMLRLFLMTLVIYIVVKVKKQTNIQSGYYWFAILFTSILFGIGHFGANVAIFGELTTVVIVRALLLNGVGGIAFGYLYWKHGLQYAIIAHAMTHISMQLIFIPLFY